MDLSFRNVLLGLGFILLLFFGIPININKNSKSEKQLLFQSYLNKYNKSYKKDSLEYQIRFQHFQESIATIERLNSLRPNEDSAYYGLTPYSDLSADEFRHHHLQKDLYKKVRKHPNHHVSTSMYQRHNHHKNRLFKRAINELPAKVDWREKGVVTGVRNQKLCGACWAFSTVETVESMWAIKNGTLLNLSVQEIIDCARNGNLGCNGGDTCSLLDWLTENNININLENDYPLVLSTRMCKLKKNVGGVKVASNYSCDYLVGKEDVLLSLLANHGPVTAAVNALTWQYYVGGVIQFHCSGGPFDINHAVQIVGYDKTAPTPHYIVRNSWGSLFGDKGYLYLAIGSNMCGVATEVTALDVV